MEHSDHWMLSNSLYKELVSYLVHDLSLITQLLPSTYKHNMWCLCTVGRHSDCHSIMATTTTVKILVLGLFRPYLYIFLQKHYSSKSVPSYLGAPLLCVPHWPVFRSIHSSWWSFINLPRYFAYLFPYLCFVFLVLKKKSFTLLDVGFISIFKKRLLVYWL